MDASAGNSTVMDSDLKKASYERPIFRAKI